MAYTAYRTWTTGEIVTAALMNEQVKDNGLLTAPAIMTTAGDIIYASAANTPARLAKSTTSTQFLANTGTSNVPQWNEVALATGVSGTLPVANGGTGITSLGSNVATFLGTPSSANLRSALTDEPGTGGAVFATSPTLVTPALGTPASGVLTNATGLPEAGLAVSNAPTNGYMLTAQSGDAGGMTWAAASGARSVAGDTDNAIMTWVTSDNTFAAEADLTYTTPVLTFGGNLAFPATVALNAGANILDDFEQGTFTITLQDDSRSDSESQTYYEQLGRYQKVGRDVSIMVSLQINSLGTLTTSEDMAIAGLPFTSLNSGGAKWGMGVGVGTSLAITAGHTVTMAITKNQSVILVYKWDLSSGTGPLLISEFSAEGTLSYSGVYETAS